MGFTLLRYKLHFTFSPIVLNINSIISIPSNNKEGMNYSIRTSALTSRITSQISNEIQITEIEPEILNITLDSLKSKYVPIALDIGVSFKNQYNISSQIVIKPDSVQITGPGTVIEKIDTVYSEQEEFRDINKTINKKISLVRLQNTTLLPKEVEITIPVEEFTEKNFPVPVAIIDKPDSLNIRLFPSDIQVSFMVALSKYSEISASGFQFTIPYSEIEKNTALLSVEVGKTPDFIQDLKFTPPTLEYLIEKR